ncbi:phage major capsid protein, partial [Eubacteriales bacterium OttesenSCG-928-A19]|nr:phage major capsid protein [Eubacteriales bacterium OttesenSCG-928-A19]
MNHILELREKRAKVWETAKNFLDSKRGTDGLISPEDTATYEKMEADVVAMGREIERLERQAVLDAELAKPLATPITNLPLGGGDGDDKTGLASNTYQKNFWLYMRQKNAPEVITNSLKIGEDAQGGFLVPDEFERRLIEALEEENIFRGLATIIRTSSGDRKIPVVATKGEASWVEEEGEVPESDDTFGQVSIGAYKLATMLRISEELINDSAFDMAAYVAREFGRRIGNKEEESFLTGDGTGKPQGLLSDTGGAQTGVTAAAEAAITWDEVIDLFYSLKSPYRRTSTFITNDATMKELRKLKDQNGNYMWQPSLTAATPDTILNRPVRTSAYMPTMGAGAKALLFGDFRYYWIADRQGRSFRRLDELYAKTLQVGFLAWQRVDGRLILPEAIKALKMSGT